MPGPKPVKAIEIRELVSIADLKQAEELEREVWQLSDVDVTPATFSIASREAGCKWIGAFDGSLLVGFAFAFFGVENGKLMVHSHMMGIRDGYRDLDLGYKLKLAQRDWVLALRVNDTPPPARGPLPVRVKEITWTFDPLQSRNAHFNFAKLGVVSEKYVPDFYGQVTSSPLHQNGTDRLWVKWVIGSRRVQERVRGKDNREQWLDSLRHLAPVLQFYGDNRPRRQDLDTALTRQRIAIEVPSDIVDIESRDIELAREWRASTKWAFTNALSHGFLVAEFCRHVRGQQGPGVYILEKANVGEYIPDIDF